MQVAENGNAMQALFNQNGTDRIRMSLNSAGPSVSFFDAGHHRRWISGVTSDGRSIQEFYDGNGTRRIAFAVFPTGRAEEDFFGANGKLRLFFQSEEGEVSSKCGLCDAKGIPRLGFVVERDGHLSGLLQPPDDPPQPPTVTQISVD